LLLVVLHPPTNVLASLDENHSTSEMEFVWMLMMMDRFIIFIFSSQTPTFSLHFKITPVDRRGFLVDEYPLEVVKIFGFLLFF
jgi:hypothetical protein